MVGQNPKASSLWLAALWTGQASQILDSTLGGIPPISLPMASWTGVLQSFTQIDYHSISNRNGCIPRAREFSTIYFVHSDTPHPLHAVTAIWRNRGIRHQPWHQRAFVTWPWTDTKRQHIGPSRRKDWTARCHANLRSWSWTIPFCVSQRLLEVSDDDSLCPKSKVSEYLKGRGRTWLIDSASAILKTMFNWVSNNATLT